MITDVESTVRIYPTREEVSGTAGIPNSKPHMQRALLLSLLANAPSVIVNPDWSSEARNLFEAGQQFGMGVDHCGADGLYLSGVGRSLGSDDTTIFVGGSAFNFRTLAAVASLSTRETVLEGDTSMLARPVRDYLSFLPELGATVVDASDGYHMRIRIRGSERLGNTATVSTRHSSQVLTAVLLIAPLADEPVRVRCSTDELVGEGYVRLTESMMRAQGVDVEQDGHSFLVSPGAYRAQVHHLASDFTAMSYIAGIVAVASTGAITITEYYPSGMGSEQEFLMVLRRLGIHTVYDPLQRSLHIERGEPVSDEVEIDGSNIPTVVPTLAAIAPYIDAQVTVRNVAHVNNHKCRRVDAMLHELARLGCAIEAIYDRNHRVDGFSTRGRQAPAGDVALNSHGDHRVFLSLAVAATGARHPSMLGGAQHLHASFPEFLTVLGELGVDLALNPSNAEELVAQ